jgi:hypothetical protein
MHRWVASTLAGWFLLGAAPAAFAADDERAFFETLRLLQVESQNVDQAYVLDVSGSMKATLPVSRKMMTEFIRDLARDGDRLLVVAVGAGARVLINEDVGTGNRQRLLKQVADPNFTNGSADFESATDLDAGTFEVLKRFDGLNEARMRHEGTPRRQIIHTFSDFKKEPLASSPFAQTGSAQSQALSGLQRRIKRLTVKDAPSIKQDFPAINFNGVPFRIEQTEFLLPTQGKGAALSAFDGYLRQMIADEFEVRTRTPERANRFAKRLDKLRGEVAKRLVIANPTNFTMAPGGKGVVGVVKVKNGFQQTTMQAFGLAVVSTDGDTVAEVPAATTDLAPDQEAAFEVTFPELVAPKWYSLEPIRYQGQRLTLRPIGTAKIGEKNPDTRDLAMLAAAQTLTFDIEIPPNPTPLFGLGALLLALLAGGGVWFVRAQLGPKELTLQVKIHDPSGDAANRELKLANGGYLVFGGKDRGNVIIPGIEEPLVKIVRKGTALVAEGAATRLHVLVDAQNLKEGQAVALKEKGRILAKQDTVGAHLVEIAYLVGGAAGPTKPASKGEGPSPASKPTADGTLPTRGGRRKF